TTKMQRSEKTNIPKALRVQKDMECQNTQARRSTGKTCEAEVETKGIMCGKAGKDHGIGNVGLL
ncbi:MAG TPA: hypothetical protein V6C97_31710, partial [Oculatellaceae cyanobacterium]